MEVIPYSEFVLKMSEKEFRLLSLCVAHCAGIKEAKPKPAEANALNLALTKSFLRIEEEKTEAARRNFEKATSNEAPEEHGDCYTNRL